MAVTLSTPRLEINLRKLQENARTVVERLARLGVSVMGVTKVTLGSPEIARQLIAGGVTSLGDSRIENIRTMRLAGVLVPICLIRPPMLSQVDRVVEYADVSFNTELEVIERLSNAAEKQGKTHGIVLMIELGDLREGILPRDMESVAMRALEFPNVVLHGVATNLACRSGVAPDQAKMDELSTIVDSLESACGTKIVLVSGGNSANLNWAFGESRMNRVNNLRLGEALLLGRDPLERQSISGLHTDAIMLIAELIESKIKPSKPWGQIAASAVPRRGVSVDRGEIVQGILAVGRQDVDPEGLLSPEGVSILAASSDHLVVEIHHGRSAVGTTIHFQVNYSALLRAMTSPFVEKIFIR